MTLAKRRNSIRRENVGRGIGVQVRIGAARPISDALEFRVTKVLSAFVALVFLMGMLGNSRADAWDPPNNRFCSDGKRVSDQKKCNRNPDGSCKPGRQCKGKPLDENTRK